MRCKLKKDYETPALETVETVDVVTTSSGVVTPEHPFSWGR